MMAFIIGLIAMVIIVVIGVGCLFVVDRLGIEMIILTVMACIISYVIGDLILNVF